LEKKPPFQGAPILLAGENFGCGSSREGAVWTLMGMGLRCVIAPSFGDIFHNNCFQNGLLPVRLPSGIIRRMAEAMEDSPGNARATVELQRQVVMTPLGRGGALRGGCAEAGGAAERPRRDRPDLAAGGGDRRLAGAGPGNARLDLGQREPLTRGPAPAGQTIGRPSFFA
jgi:hypothetical protein